MTAAHFSPKPSQSRKAGESWTVTAGILSYLIPSIFAVTTLGAFRTIFSLSNQGMNAEHPSTCTARRVFFLVLLEHDVYTHCCSHCTAVGHNSTITKVRFSLLGPIISEMKCTDLHTVYMRIIYKICKGDLTYLKKKTVPNCEVISSLISNKIIDGDFLISTLFSALHGAPVYSAHI